MSVHSVIVSQSTLSTPTGVIVPLYSYPGSDWNIVEQAKYAHPSVPIVAIVSPDNGPGSSQDPNYVSGVDNLRSAGVTVLGYVYTSYASRSSASVIADINTYKSWYNINGIFFDEMSNVPGNEAYYLALSTYAKSIGLGFTVGNPGRIVPASYIGTVDCIVTYENQGLPNISSLASLDANFSKNGLAAISYGVNALDTSFAQSASKYVGYIYLTDNSLPNPYSELPPYFSSLVASLDTSSATSSSTTTITKYTQPVITRTSTSTTATSTTTYTHKVSTTTSDSSTSTTDTHSATVSTSVTTGIVTSIQHPTTTNTLSTTKNTAGISITPILFLAVVLALSAVTVMVPSSRAFFKRTMLRLHLRKELSGGRDHDS
ncbi:MAG: spherulation-specific family 4 protein [Nitrososphaerales archaeon]